MTYTTEQLLRLPECRQKPKPEDVDKIKQQLAKGKKEWKTASPLYLGSLIRASKKV
jgi:hypothetical protein